MKNIKYTLLHKIYLFVAKKIKFTFSILLLIGAFSSSVPFASELNNSDASIQSSQSSQSSYRFDQLTDETTITLNSDLSSTQLYFSARSDEVIVKAQLAIRYTYSPSLIAKQSHVKVYFNDEIIQVLPIDHKSFGHQNQHTFDIDPLLITDFNRIRFVFVGHYKDMCEDPTHSSLWVDLSRNSSLEVWSKPITFKNDLSTLPEPFFDRKDNRILKLPFIFSTAPSHETLETAAVLASWFGSMAAWRGSDFPVFLDKLPARHGVVFATNATRPAFLAQYPLVDAPTIEIITHPDNPFVKLLLLQGRDQDDLRKAVNALVLGHSALTGHAITVNQLSNLPTRKPYDATNWIRTDRLMTLGELVDSPTALEASGYRPDPIKVNIHVPPDLFTWRNAGIPLNLRYRYTGPPQINESRLNISINDQFLDSFHLESSGRSGNRGEGDRLRIPLIEDWIFGPGQELLIPAFKIGSKNQLKFNYSFSRVQDDACTNNPLHNTRGSINGNSTIDFTGFPHYAKMPNLSFFATSGFPFSRLADLSETALVIPRKPSEAEIYALFNIMGHIGATTGDAAIRLRVLAHHMTASMAHKDLLLIGNFPQLPQRSELESALPVLVSETKKVFFDTLQPAISEHNRLRVTASEEKVKKQISPNTQLSVTGNGALGTILGFESPFTKKRSVIALIANNPATLIRMSQSFSKPGILSQMKGGAIIYRDNKIDSYELGKSYLIGDLPTLPLIWYRLSQHPIEMAIVSLLAVLVIGFLLWRILKSIAKTRLSN